MTLIHRIPVILLGFAIVFAPFAWGGTTPVTRGMIDGLLAAAGLSHLAVKLVQRRRLTIPAGVLVILGLLSLQALIMVANPHFFYDRETGQFDSEDSVVWLLPGTMDRANSLPVVIHFLAMTLAFLAVIDLAKQRENRWTFLRVIGLTGGIIAVVGIFQKAIVAESMLWIDDVYEERTFFAGFRYHAHAAAFLNLCWPASLALLLRSFHCGESHLLRAIWANAFLFTFAALFVNSSKYGHVIALPALILAFLVFRRWIPSPRDLSKTALMVGGVVVVAAVVALALISVELSAGKWDQLLNFDGDNSLDRRFLTQGVCVKILADTPLLGFGPGTFRLVFPFYSQELGGRITGFWYHAHQDYLEVLIDWGWVGGGLWIGLFAWGVGRGIRRRWRTQSDLTIEAALVALILVGLHALVDFPLQIPALQLVAMIYLGMLFAAPEKNRRRRRRRRKPSSGGNGAHDPTPEEMRRLLTRPTLPHRF